MRNFDLSEFPYIIFPLSPFDTIFVNQVLHTNVLFEVKCIAFDFCVGAPLN